MNRYWLIAAIALGLPQTLIVPASALSKRTSVASTGNDAADCERATPCRSFQGALDKTAAGGEIFCIDSAAYSDVAIYQSVTISCDHAIGSTFFNSNQSFGGVFVSIAAGDRVILRGLDLNIATSTSSSAPLAFVNAGTLVVDHCKLAGGRGSVGFGIEFVPTGAGKLMVTDTLITNSGDDNTGAGIRVRPSGSGTAQVSIRNSVVSGNAFGIAIDGSNSTGGINATIVDTMSSSNPQDGIIATSSSSKAPISVSVINSQSLNNAIGIRSIGSNVTVRVKNSEIIGNGTGLSFVSGGALLSGGSNTVQANGTNGSFSGSYALQ